MITFAKKMMAGGSDSNKMSQKLNKMAFILPLFIAEVDGIFDVDITPEDIATIMELPQAALAEMNVHSLLLSMSPWGTLDNFELIQNDDEDADVAPIWGGFPERDEWTTEKDAVENYFKRIQKLLTTVKNKE